MDLTQGGSNYSLFEGMELLHGFKCSPHFSLSFSRSDQSEVFGSRFYLRPSRGSSLKRLLIWNHGV